MVALVQISGPLQHLTVATIGLSGNIEISLRGLVLSYLTVPFLHSVQVTGGKP